MKIILTHSFKYELDADGRPIGDPGMTPEGIEAIQGLALYISSLFPDGVPEYVISGSGLRHLQIAETLGFPVNLVTPLLGGPESLVSIGGVKKIVLASGRTVKYDGEYQTGVTPENVMEVLRKAPDNTFFGVGRPTILFGDFSLTKEQCKSGAVYSVEETSGKMELILLRDGVILGDGDGAKV